MISELVLHGPLGACEGHQRNSFVTPCECIRRHATSPLPTVPLALLRSRHHRFPHHSTQNGANLLSCCFMACFLRSAVTFLTAAFIFDISDFDSAVKVKVIPQQAEVAQGVPRRLSPRIFLTFGTTRVVDRQPYVPAAFTPREIPGTHFQRLSRPQGTWFRPWEPRKKSPVTSPGIDPGTVRLAAQCLNHYATPGPFDSAVACPIQRESLCGDLFTGVLQRSFSCRGNHRAFC